MKAIELHGSFYKKNDKGFLVNTTSIERLSIDTIDFLDKIIIEYKRIFPNLDSIYIRGSAAEGKFREGVSDIDTFALIEKIPIKSQLEDLKETSTRLSKIYKNCIQVDLECVSKNDVLFDSDYKFMQTVIKIQSYLIMGDTYFQNSLPEIKPNSSLISLIFNLENRLNFAVAKIETIGEIEIKYWCHWTMKTIIRACFELVIDKVEEYTRDLYLCYTEFTKYYPNKKDICYQALNFAINPTNNKNEILKIIKQLGYWVVNESKNVYPHKEIVIKKPISTKYLNT